MTQIRLVQVIIMLLLASCAGPIIETERYHRIASDNQAGTGAVVELQYQAFSALHQGSIQLAIDNLQRAIKIEPRNPFSWHYLAQTYWHDRNYASCLDMIERSISYSSAGDDLDRANRALRAQCVDE